MANSLNTLHPAPLSSLVEAQEQNIITLRDNLSNRLDKLVCFEKHCSINGWITPLGTFSKQLETYGKSGYNSNMYGVLGGIDLKASRNLCMGAACGYTKTQVDWLGPIGNGNAKTGYLALYAREFNSHYFLDGSIILGYNRFSSNRAIHISNTFGAIARTAEGKYCATEVDSHVSMGTILKNQYYMDITFKGSLDWIFTHENSFTESGAGEISLYVKGKNCNLLRPAISMALSKCLGNWKPEIGLTGAYYARLEGSSFTSRFVDSPGWFCVNGTYPTQARAIPQASITGSFLNNRLTVQAAYKGEFSYNYFEHDFSFNLGYCF